MLYLYSLVVVLTLSLSSFRLSGCLPFFGETHNELFKRIMEGTFYFPTAQWGHISDSGW